MVTGNAFKKMTLDKAVSAKIMLKNLMNIFNSFYGRIAISIHEYIQDDIWTKNVILSQL